VPLTGGQRFGFGALGAASPEIIRWYKIAQDTTPTLPHSWAVYLLATATFILAGGGFAALWQDDSPIKCFYFGVTFPLFVSAILAGPAPTLPK
jgi:hypothetical protein